jgi:hypothetical protein
VPKFAVIVAPLLLNCDAFSVNVPAPAPVDRIMLGEKVLPTANAACSTSSATFVPARREGPIGAGEADGGTWFWLASAASFPVCAIGFAFDRGIAGAAGRFAETVGEAAPRCIERLKETSDGVTAGKADDGTWLWLASAASLPVCAMRFAFDCGIAVTAGRFAETVREVASHCIERPMGTSGRVTAVEAVAGAGLWLVSATSLPVCVMEFEFGRGTAGTAGGAAEAVGEVALHCIERPKESSDTVTAGEAGGTWLWLAWAASLPVCAMELAFDCATAGTAGRFAEAV